MRVYPTSSLLTVVISTAVGLSSCKKPEGAKLLVSQNTVSAEAGPLPGVGAANRLMNEQSAFLRKHAQDPVDWYPWGKDAFDKAKELNRPIIVSVGYASCPWSQKMQEDSFVDPKIARFMNRHYVCILVDREERPDVNNSFLHYLYWKQKSSGWPMHIWLTPEGQPIYQGVYFPAQSTGPAAGWSTVIEHVANTWESDASYIRNQATEVNTRYMAEYERMWEGANPLGDPEVPEVKKFLARPAAERVNELRNMTNEAFFGATRYLPSTELNDLWVLMKPAERLNVIARSSAQAAAVLAVKLTGPERDEAFKRFVTAARAASYEKYSSIFDPVNGGFAQAPKFFQPQMLEHLVDYAIRSRGDRYGKQHNAMEMVMRTLDRALAGGITDQLSGGFHRYATDPYWILPQFEKMAYDQGLVSAMLVRVGQATGKKDYIEAALRALRYATTELAHPEGGVYCAEGSSSAVTTGAKELTEGAFYVWEKKEIDAILGPDAPFATAVFGLDDHGNLPIESITKRRMPTANILTIQKRPAEIAADFSMTAEAAEAKLEEVRMKLLEVRRKRPRPTLDDKVLASWNGPIISALALASWATNDPSLMQRAVKAGDFILTKLRTKDGALIHAFLDGPSGVPGFSEDYATVVRACTDLYSFTGDVKWLRHAAELQERQMKDLWDPKNGGFVDGPESPLLFHRVKSVDEATELSAGAVSAQNLIRLSSFLNIPTYRASCRQMLERYGSQAGTSPISFLRFMRVAEQVVSPPLRIVISGAVDAPDRAAMLNVVRRFHVPDSVVLHMDGGESQKFLLEKHPELSSLGPKSGQTSIHFSRSAPVIGKPLVIEKTAETPADLEAWLTSECCLPAK